MVNSRIQNHVSFVGYRPPQLTSVIQLLYLYCWEPRSRFPVNQQKHVHGGHAPFVSLWYWIVSSGKYQKVPGLSESRKIETLRGICRTEELPISVMRHENEVPCPVWGRVVSLRPARLLPH